MGRLAGREAKGEAIAEGADATAEHLGGLLDLAAASKLRERAPQDFHDFIAQAAEDTPFEFIYIAAPRGI